MLTRIFVRLDPIIHIRASIKETSLFVPVLFTILCWASPFLTSPTMPMSLIEKICMGLVPGWSDSSAIKVKGLIGTLLATLVIILSFNFVRLLPYTLRFTAHLFLAVTLALPFWLSILASGWVKSLKKASARLVPQGAPIALGPFVALLETVRLLVRPISLRLRLIVNIRAGHLLLSLMRQLVLSLSLSFAPGAFVMFLIEVGYFILELGISFIQAYIFTTLLSLYANEHPDR